MRDVEKYIKNLINEGEHQQQDFKFEISDAKKIARTLVAFANTDGGRLLIGVKDNGRIRGIKSEEEYYMIDAAASMYCKPPIPFQGIRRVAEGKTILEVVIEPSDKKPHFARDEQNRWMAYRRYKDNNHLADYIQLNVWKREKRKQGTFITYSDKEKLLLKYLDGRGSVDFSSLQLNFTWSKKSLQHILINLISLKVVNMTYGEDHAIFSLEEQTD